MGDKEWNELHRPLSGARMSDQEPPSAAGGRTDMRTANRSARLKKAAWWAGTVAIAAAVAAFALLGRPGKQPVPPIQPATQGPGPGAAKAPAVAGPIVSVAMVNGQAGWAAGQDGHVLRTTDGGVTWVDVTPVDVPGADPATRPYFPVFLPDDPQAAWFVDIRTETVYRTTDGGQTWQKGTPPALAMVPDGGESLSFTSETAGWLIASTGAHQQAGQLFATTDGGMT